MKSRLAFGGEGEVGRGFMRSSKEGFGGQCVSFGKATVKKKGDDCADQFSLLSEVFGGKSVEGLKIGFGIEWLGAFFKKRASSLSARSRSSLARCILARNNPRSLRLR